MVEKLLKLRQQFHVKTLQIEALVAKKHGMGNLDDLAPADYQRVQTITGNLLEMWEEGEHEAGFVHDDTSFNKLAQERHDIEEQILNIRDDEIAKEKQGQ